MVRLNHFLAYEMKLNINIHWDISHDTNNNNKNDIKECGLWRHKAILSEVDAFRLGRSLKYTIG